MKEKSILLCGFFFNYFLLIINRIVYYWVFRDIISILFRIFIVLMYQNNLAIKTEHSTVLNQISSFLLLFITFLVPLFFIPSSFVIPQYATSFLFGLGVILSILLYIISSFETRSIELPHPAKYLLWPIVIVPIVYIIAGIGNGFSRMVFFGYSFDQSTVGFMTLGFIYFFLISVLLRNKKKIVNGYIAFGLSFVIVSLFLLIRIVFGESTLSFGIFTKLTSTMLGSWNSVGIFFGISALLSLITLEMLPLEKVFRVILYVAFCVSLFFLTLVNFSFVWYTIIAVTIVFIIYRVFNSGTGISEFVPPSFTQKLSQVSAKTFLVLVLALVFVFSNTTVGGFLARKFSVSNVEVRPSFSVTFDIIKSTLDAKPLFGSGPNTFLLDWLVYKPADVVTSIFWNTDFTYGVGFLPTLVVTTGIAGLISWLIFFALYLSFGFKALKLKSDDISGKYLLVSSFITSLFLWIMCVVYVPSTVLFILTLFFTGLFFASVYATGLSNVRTYMFMVNPGSRFVSVIILGATFILSLVGGYSLLQNAQSFWYFQKSAYVLNTENDFQKSEAYMSKAIAIVPFDAYFRALSEIELSILNQVVTQDPEKVSQEELKKQVTAVLSNAVNAALAARDRDPSNYVNWISLGRVYEFVAPLQISGAYESAQLAYSEALKRNPKNPSIILMFAQLEIDHGNLPQAKEYVLQAIAQKQNYLEAYYLLSQIEVSSKNIKGATEAISAALVIAPNDPTLLFQFGLLKYNAQDFGGAVEAFQKALVVEPKYMNAQYFLALSHELLGQHAKAIALLTQLSKDNPNNKDIETLLNNIKAGRSIK